MKIGYARVSTTDQNLRLQLDAFRTYGCDRVFEDRSSGAKVDRPGLTAALSSLNPGDTLVVWKLDRLGRSLQHLITTMNQLRDKGVELQSITEHIDTSTPGGKLVFHLFGALAEFERDLIRERIRAGLMAANQRGKRGGRPKKLGTAKMKEAKRLYNEGSYSISQICDILSICKSTLYIYLKK